VRRIALDRATGLATGVVTVAGQATAKKHGCNYWADGGKKTAAFDFIHGHAFLPLR
jgi:hypothetical protein